MADSDSTTARCHSDLQVQFSRQEEPDLELIFIAANGEAALKAARRILDMHTELQAGDEIVVSKYRRPGIVERNLG
jgi:hypothetical protein